MLAVLAFIFAGVLATTSGLSVYYAVKDYHDFKDILRRQDGES